MHVKVGPALLGRVLNGLGQPIDEDVNGPLTLTESYPVINPPPDPLKPGSIVKPIPVGVRCIDGVLTCGRGQRVGIFAAAGKIYSSLA